MLIGIAIAVLALALIGAMAINEPAHVGPADSVLQLQASATKTATFSGTAVDLGSGFAASGAGQPMQANVSFSAADFTTGDETYTFTLEHSDSSGSGFTACSAAVSSGVSATVAAAAIAVGGFVAKRYVRLTMTAAGTTPSITYQAYLSPFVNARP